MNRSSRNNESPAPLRWPHQRCPRTGPRGGYLGWPAIPLGLVSIVTLLPENGEGRASARLLASRDVHQPIADVQLAPGVAVAAMLHTGGRLSIWEVGGIGRWSDLGGDAFVNVFAFAPGETRIALGCLDGDIRVVELDTGREALRILAGETTVSALAFAPDGKTLASGDHSGRLVLWDVETGSPLREVAPHVGAVTALAFSADGRQLVSASSPSVEIVVRETATGAMIASRPDGTGLVKKLAFLPGDAQLVWFNRGSGDIRRWDFIRGQCQSLPRNRASIVAMAMGPGDATVVLRREADTAMGLLEFYEPSTWQIIREVPMPGRDVKALAISDDGALAVLGGVAISEIHTLHASPFNDHHAKGRPLGRNAPSSLWVGP